MVVTNSGIGIASKAGDYLKNGHVRNVDIYQGAFTAWTADQAAHQGTIQGGDWGGTTAYGGTFATPLKGGMLVKQYVKVDGYQVDDTYRALEAADETSVIVGELVDDPVGKVNDAYWKSSVYFYAPGDVKKVHITADNTNDISLKADIKVTTAASVGFGGKVTEEEFVYSGITTPDWIALDNLGLATSGYVRMKIVNVGL